MSKHVWLSPPSPERAMWMEAAFLNAKALHASDLEAAGFSAYDMERTIQAGRQWRHIHRRNSLRDGKWKCAYGKNAVHYLFCFVQHLSLMKARMRKRFTLDYRWLSTQVLDQASQLLNNCAINIPHSIRVLGDALMDAGCDNEELLARCQKGEYWIPYLIQFSEAQRQVDIAKSLKMDTPAMMAKGGPDPSKGKGHA